MISKQHLVNVTGCMDTPAQAVTKQRRHCILELLSMHEGVHCSMCTAMLTRDPRDLLMVQQCHGHVKALHKMQETQAGVIEPKHTVCTPERH